MRLLVLALTLAALSVRAQDLGGDLTLHKLLIDGENWTLVTEGLGFADGPCTDAEGNFYFSDLKANAIYKIDLYGSRIKLIDEPGSGLKWKDGYLFACQGSKKRLVIIDLERKTAEVLASNVEPNDLAVSARGQIFFTETGKKQVSFIDFARGTSGFPLTVRAVDTGITAPNGLALSPDQGTLAVSDYGGEFVWTFRIAADGTLDAKMPTMPMRLPIDPAGEFKFAQPPPYQKSAKGDGMCTDTIGRYYVTSALGVQVFDPTNRPCGILPAPQPGKPLTSCALAGPGRAYLYVTNGDKIFRRKVQATGNFPAELPK